MSCWILTLALLAPMPRVNGVTVRLFGLFEPKQVTVRVASGDALVEATDSSAVGRFLRFSAEETLLVRFGGQELNISVTDHYGRASMSISSSHVSITPPSGINFELSVPRGPKRLVKGDLRISPTPDGVLAIVVTTAVESAVSSIVNAEMGDITKREALKALAVAARSYILTHTGRHRSEGFDYCDTTHCQFFGEAVDPSTGVRAARVYEAVVQTKQECLLFAERIVEGHYSASCGGLSATPEMVWGGRTTSGYPYRRVACRWCRQSPYWRWTRSARAESVLSSLSSSVGFRPGLLAQLKVESATSGGFVNAVVVVDGSHSARITTDRFRRAVGRSLGWNIVLSPTFTIERRGSRLAFIGRGFGSQVGLCLAGAIAQAGAGRTYREILKYYYPECELGRDSGVGT